MTQQIILRDQQDRVKVCNLIEQLAIEKPWVIEIREHRLRRTDEQNRYLWGLVYQTILDAGGNDLAGWTKDDLHDYFLGEHFGWEELSGLGKKRIRPLRRSSKLSIEEFSSYIAFIQQRCAELGIYIPDANEPT